ncbi:MAG: hypothetical protein KIT09_23760 [Bryobacteraceae bacterium]|nr:hypothetical protein [Bryobacteraceae bacterium]
MGDGTTTPRSTPVPVNGLAGAGSDCGRGDAQPGSEERRLCLGLGTQPGRPIGRRDNHRCFVADRGPRADRGRGGRRGLPAQPGSRERRDHLGVGKQRGWRIGRWVHHPSVSPHPGARAQRDRGGRRRRFAQPGSERRRDGLGVG